MLGRRKNTNNSIKKNIKRKYSSRFESSDEDEDDDDNNDEEINDYIDRITLDSNGSDNESDKCIEMNHLNTFELTVLKL